MSEKKIQLFNKSARTFHLTAGSLKPTSQLAVPEAEAEKLLKMFPNEITKLNDIAVVDTHKVKYDAEVVAHEATKAEKKELEDKISAMEKEYSELKKENDKLVTENKKLKKEGK